MNGQSGAVCRALDGMGISYEHMEHPPVMTMEDCLPIEQKMNAHVCKNVFLQNRQGTEYFLLIMRSDKRFRTADVSKKLERARLSFGSEEKLEQFLHLKGGAVSPLGLLFDEGQQVQLVVDRDLTEMDFLCFHPCVNTEMVKISGDDFFHRFLPETRHTPIVIEL